MMPYLECMAESAGSFYHVVDDAVSEREHVQTILTQMQGDWANGVLMNGKFLCIYHVCKRWNGAVNIVYQIRNLTQELIFTRFLVYCRCEN